MWTPRVVVLAPSRDLVPSIVQIPKPAHIQTLVPKSTMEALHVRVLRRLARLDVPHIDLPPQCPREEMTTRQLRAVVTANRQWASASGDDLIQPRLRPASAQQ